MNNPFHGKALYCLNDKHRRVKSNGYYAIYMPNHPNAFGRGYVYEHRTLKKSLKNNEYALSQFMEEVNKNIDEVRKYGIFFNFVSDPFLPETFKLNLQCMAWCVIKEVKYFIFKLQT